MNAPDQFLLYTAPDGAVKVNVLCREETVWLTQEVLAELFGVQFPAVTKHFLNIFKTGELQEGSVSSILEHTAADGKNTERNTAFSPRLCDLLFLGDPVP